MSQNHTILENMLKLASFLDVFLIYNKNLQYFMAV